MIPDVCEDTLLPIIRQKVVPDSIVYTDSYPAYDVLDVSEFHHHRIDTQTPMLSIAKSHQRKSRTSGTRPSARSDDTTAFRKPTFRSFSRRPNFASTTENPASNCELSNAGPNSSLSQLIWDIP
jgi:transposase-like protein